MTLSISVYQITNSFPPEEKFGITQQIRKCAVSIASNIAEGSGRRSRKEFKHFMNIAYGSTCELETQLIIANRTGFLETREYHKLLFAIDEIQKMTYRLFES